MTAEYTREEQELLVRTCRCALDAFLTARPIFATLAFGGTTIGGLSAELNAPHVGSATGLKASELEVLLKQCGAAMDALLGAKPKFGAFDFGTGTLGNLRVDLHPYRAPRIGWTLAHRE